MNHRPRLAAGQWPPRVALPPSAAAVLEAAGRRCDPAALRAPGWQREAVRDLRGDPGLARRLALGGRLLRERQAVVFEGVPTGDVPLVLVAAALGVADAEGNGPGAGQLVWPLRPDRAPEYRYAALALHTDSVFAEEPHPAMGLACEQASAAGGESLLARAADIVRAVRAEGGADVVALLHDTPFPFATDRPDLPPVRFAPVLRTVDGDTQVRFLGRAVRSGLELAPGAVDDAALAALTVFEEELARPEHQAAIPLRPGELLVWDNRRLLHGRAAIGPGGDGRLLKRVKLARLHDRWQLP